MCPWLVLDSSRQNTSYLYLRQERARIGQKDACFKAPSIFSLSRALSMERQCVEMFIEGWLSCCILQSSKGLPQTSV